MALAVGAQPPGCDPGNPGLGEPNCGDDDDLDRDQGHGNESPGGTTGTTGTTGSTGSGSSGGGGGGGGGDPGTQDLTPLPGAPGPDGEGPPGPDGQGPPAFDGDGSGGGQSVAPGPALSNLLLPLAAFAAVALASIFGMNRPAPVRLQFEQYLGGQAAEAWVEFFDPIEGELLMTVPAALVVEDISDEMIAAGVEAPEPYWAAELSVSRQGQFHAMLRYLTPDAHMQVMELGLFELRHDELLFEEEFEQGASPTEVERYGPSPPTGTEVPVAQVEVGSMEIVYA
jgi:hypothetical protein